MKQIWKRMIALLCALTLVCGGIMTQGNGQTANASSEATEGAEFGKTDSYLQLTESLAATPSAVEATVKMDKFDEWTILSVNDTTTKYWYPSALESADIPVSITSYPDNSLTYAATTVAASGKFGFRKAFDINMPDIYENDDIAIAFWLYNPNDTLDGTLEITSSGGPDEQEINWNIANKVSATSGWNYIKLSLDSNTSTTGGSFNLQNVNYVRWYGTTNSSDESVAYVISDIKLIVLEDAATEVTVVSPEMLQSYMDTQNQAVDIETVNNANEGPEVGLQYVKIKQGTAATNCNVKFSGANIVVSPYEDEESVLAFWIKSNLALSNASLELSSSTSNNADELEWDFGAKVGAGWTYIELPLSEAKPTGSFNKASICRVRVHTTKADGTTDAPEIYLSEIKLIHKELVTESSTISSANMILSNVNATGETNSYAFGIAKGGYPTLIYGSNQYTLNHDIRTGEQVTLKVLVNDDSKIEFYVDGTLTGTSKNTVETLGVPTTSYCIGADGLGAQFMQGYIYNVCVSDGEDIVGSWAISSDVSKDIPDAQGSGIYAEYKGTAVQACPYVTRYYGTIDSYRGTVVDGKYTNVPQKEGYVFAGWYTDETCGNPLAFDTTTDDAYAKFVDSKILTVLAQSKYTEGSENKKLDIRFVTTVDELNYKEVGFVVTNRAGTKYTYPEQYVYTSLNAAGVTYAPADKFSQHSTRFATIQMTGVTIENESNGISANRDIPVQAYWVTKDGSIVYGTARKVNVQVAANAASDQATVINVD